jgi:hypothetical protein
MQSHKEGFFSDYVYISEWMENEAVVEGHELTSQRQTIDQSASECRCTQHISIRDDKNKMLCWSRKQAEREKADVHFAVWSVCPSVYLSVCLAVRLFNCLAVWYGQHPGNLIWHCDDITQTERKRVTGRKLCFKKLTSYFCTTVLQFCSSTVFFTVMHSCNTES